MKTTKASIGKPATSLDLAPLEYVRSLAELCRKFLYEYYETGAPWSGPDWWRSFNEAGMCLRDALEREKGRGNLQEWSNQEQEHIYLLLIRVAYFFEPAGPAESFFLEQGWVRGQISSEEAVPMRARPKRWLITAGGLQRFTAPFWGAWHRGARRERRPGGPEVELQHTAAFPVPSAQQKTGVPQR